MAGRSAAGMRAGLAGLELATRPAYGLSVANTAQRMAAANAANALRGKGSNVLRRDRA